jgi:hypothetical protein
MLWLFKAVHKYLHVFLTLLESFLIKFVSLIRLSLYQHHPLLSQKHKMDWAMEKHFNEQQGHQERASSEKPNDDRKRLMFGQSLWHVHMWVRVRN